MLWCPHRRAPFSDRMLEFCFPPIFQGGERPGQQREALEQHSASQSISDTCISALPVSAALLREAQGHRGCSRGSTGRCWAGLLPFHRASGEHLEHTEECRLQVTGLFAGWEYKWARDTSQGQLMTRFISRWNTWHSYGVKGWNHSCARGDPRFECLSLGQGFALFSSSLRLYLEEGNQKSLHLSPHTLQPSYKEKSRGKTLYLLFRQVWSDSSCSAGEKTQVSKTSDFANTVVFAVYLLLLYICVCCCL